MRRKVKNIRKRSIQDDFGLNTNKFDLLVSPGRQSLKSGKEELGYNLLDIGSFNNFTMLNDSNVKGHWIFDNKYSLDKSGNLGNNLSVNFDGVNQYLSITDASQTGLDITTTDFTIEGWFYVENYTDEHRYLITKAYDTNNRWAVLMRSDGEMSFYAYIGGTELISVRADNNEMSGLNETWVHFAVVGVRDDKSHLYINGELISAETINTMSTSDLSNSGSVEISAMTYASIYSECNIKNVSISNIARTHSEIQRIYKGTFPIDSNHKGFWKFDNIDTYLEDLTTNGNDLTNNNDVILLSGNTNYIGQDWSLGGGNLENNTMDTRFESFATYWGKESEITNDSSGVHWNTTATNRKLFQYITLPDAFAVGDIFRVEVHCSSFTSGNLNFRFGSDYYYDYDINSIGEFIFYIRITGGLTPNEYFALGNSTAVTVATIDYINCQKIVNGNHLSPINFLNGFDNLFIEESNIYKDGKVLTFNGTDQYFSIPAAQATDFNPGTGDFTIEAWFRTSDTAARQGIFHIGSQGTTNFWISIRLYSGNINVYVGDESGTYWITYVGTAVTEETWYHVALVADRSVGWYVYVNGEEVSSSTTPNSVNLIPTNYGNLNIGRDGSDYEFDGIISEVIYSNTARTATKIKENYGLGKGWVISENIDVENDNFKQKLIGTSASNPRIGVGSITFENRLYRIELSGTWDNVTRFYIYDGTAYHSPLTKSPPNNSSETTWVTLYGYFKPAATTSGLVYIYVFYDGSICVLDNIKIQPVLNILPFYEYVEDFSLGGIKEGNTIIEGGDVSDGTLPLRPSGIPIGASRGSLTIVREHVVKGNYCVKYTGDGTTAGSHYLRVWENDIGYIEQGYYRIKCEIYVPTGNASMEFTLTDFSGTHQTIVEISTKDKWVPIDLVAEVKNDGLWYIKNTNILANSDVFYVANISVIPVSNAILSKSFGDLYANQFQYPYSLEFDGVNDYIDFGNNLDVLDHDFIISAWVKVSSVGTEQIILGKWYTSNDFFALYILASGDPRICIWDSSYLIYVHSTTPVTANNWVNVSAVIKRGTTADCKIYLDCVDKTEGTPTSLTTSYSNTTELTVGSDVGLSRPFEGEIGDIMFTIFDGKDGKPSSLPINAFNWLVKFYNNTKWKYEDD